MTGGDGSNVVSLGRTGRDRRDRHHRPKTIRRSYAECEKSTSLSLCKHCMRAVLDKHVGGALLLRTQRCMLQVRSCMGTVGAVDTACSC